MKYNPRTKEKHTSLVKPQSFFSRSLQRKSEGSEFPFFQPKLSIGQPGDKYEQEADAMAEKVVSKGGNNSGMVQQKCAACGEKEGPVLTKLQRMEEEEEVQAKPQIQRMGGPEEEEAQMKPEIQREGEEEEELQAKAEGSTSAGSNFSNRLNASKGGGNPMSAGLQSEMGNSFGADFSGVRVHTDASSVQLNKDIKAQAFTHGKDVYFNQGKYQPESSEGKKLIAHELTHTIQQGAVQDKEK